MKVMKHSLNRGKSIFAWKNKYIIFIFLLVMLCIPLIKSKIVFHYEGDAPFRIKVSNLDYSISYFYLDKDETYEFLLPLYWRGDGITFFMNKESELFTKNDVDFCKIHLYFNKEKYIYKVVKEYGFCLKPIFG